MIIAGPEDGRDEDEALENGAEAEADTDEQAEEEQLTLEDEDEQLPWLESDEDYEDEGVDTARIVWFGLAALLALGAVIGGIYFATRTGPDSEIVADGSTIEAPDGPVKTRPDDPGGKTFAGTGDTAFKQGEGESTEGRIGESGDAAPGIDGVRRPGESAESGSSGEASGSGGVGVQVGAYSSRAKAEEGWRTLTGRSEALSGVKYRIVQGQADIGTVYRLQAVAGNASAADSLCDRLKADGIACQVKR